MGVTGRHIAQRGHGDALSFQAPPACDFSGLASIECPASRLLWGLGMKTVLLVDHDCLARARAVRAFTPHPEFALITVSTYLEALWVLGEHDVDLAFVDLGLPERESFELLAYLANYCPQVKVMTMSTPWGGGEGVTVLPWRGHLRKPVHAQALLSQARLEGYERGDRRPMSLHVLLRVLAHERETCTLKVHAGPRSGQLQLFCGELIHAACDGASGERAIDEMLTWRDVWMRVDVLPAGSQVTLRGRMEQLIVEEHSRDLPHATAPQLPARPPPAEAVPPAPVSALRRVVSRAVQWVAGRQTAAGSR
jgi:CheY-like chemotaxis protein